MAYTVLPPNRYTAGYLVDEQDMNIHVRNERYLKGLDGTVDIESGMGVAGGITAQGAMVATTLSLSGAAGVSVNGPNSACFLQENNLVFNRAGGSFIDQLAAGGSLAFRINSTTRLNLTASHATLTGPLTVTGALTGTSAASFGGAISGTTLALSNGAGVTVSATTTSRLQQNNLVFDNAGGSFIDQLSGSGSLVFRVNTNNRIVISASSINVTGPLAATGIISTTSSIQGAGLQISGNANVNGTFYTNTRIGIGTAAPAQPLHVANGWARFDSRVYLYTGATNSYLVAVSGGLFCSGNFTCTAIRNGSGPTVRFLASPQASTTFNQSHRLQVSIGGTSYSIPLDQL